MHEFNVTNGVFFKSCWVEVNECLLDIKIKNEVNM